MMRGRIKMYNAAKGYGFITPDTAGPDVFVHVSALRAAGVFETPEPGDVVEFETMKQGDGRMKAVGLRLLVSSVGGEG